MNDKDKVSEVESKVNNVDPVSLATMIGQGNFRAQGKKYVLKSLKLKDVDEFLGDTLLIKAQIVNLATPDAKKKIEKWLPRVLFHKRDDEQGLTLQDLKDDDWDLSDLRRIWEELCELSG